MLDWIKKWNTVKRLADYINNAGHPFVYTTNWNLVDDTLLNKTQKEELDNLLTRSYLGGAKDRMKTINREDSIKRELEDFFNLNFDSIINKAKK